MAYRNYFDTSSMAQAVYPNPFPGRFPTRIRIQARGKSKGKSFDYIGKPTSAIIQTFRRFSWQYPMKWDTVSVYDFDARGVIRATVGGLMIASTFADAYFPMPSLEDFDRIEKVFILLHRKLVKVGNKHMYVFPCLFAKDSFYQPYAEFVQVCAKGDLRGRPLVSSEMNEIWDRLVHESKKFWEKPLSMTSKIVSEADPGATAFDLPLADTGGSTQVEMPRWVAEEPAWNPPAPESHQNYASPQSSLYNSFLSSLQYQGLGNRNAQTGSLTGSLDGLLDNESGR